MHTVYHVKGLWPNHLLKTSHDVFEQSLKVVWSDLIIFLTTCSCMSFLVYWLCPTGTVTFMFIGWVVWSCILSCSSFLVCTSKCTFVHLEKNNAPARHDAKVIRMANSQVCCFMMGVRSLFLNWFKDSMMSFKSSWMFVPMSIWIDLLVIGLVRPNQSVFVRRIFSVALIAGRMVRLSSVIAWQRWFNLKVPLPERYITASADGDALSGGRIPRLQYTRIFVFWGTEYRVWLPTVMK